MVKFKFLAHFPVDHLAHPVVSSLVLLRCQFAAFAYYVIDGLLLSLLFFCKFFSQALADGLSVESEWQQLSSSLQDSSKYSGRFQQCCSLDGLHSLSYFLQYLYHSFGDSTKSTNYKWYKRRFYIPPNFQLLIKVLVLIFLFIFFQFYSVVSKENKVHYSASSLCFFCFFLFFFLLFLGLVVWPRLGDQFVFQNPWVVCASHSQG